MDENLHSPQRRLIELRIEHADLDSLIDQAAPSSPRRPRVRRLKKRRLLLRDQIARLECSSTRLSRRERRPGVLRA